MKLIFTLFLSIFISLYAKDNFIFDDTSTNITVSKTSILQDRITLLENRLSKLENSNEYKELNKKIIILNKDLKNIKNRQITNTSKETTTQEIKQESMAEDNEVKDLILTLEKRVNLLTYNSFNNDSFKEFKMRVEILDEKLTSLEQNMKKNSQNQTITLFSQEIILDPIYLEALLLIVTSLFILSFILIIIALGRSKEATYLTKKLYQSNSKNIDDKK